MRSILSVFLISARKHATRPRPTQARIDLAAVRHNYLIAKQYAAQQGNPAKAWAVVKADA